MAIRSSGRVRLLSGVLGALVLLGLGWLAAIHFRSPAQREAQSRPPAAGPIFESVRTGDLADQVSGSGTITYLTTSSLSMINLPANAVVTRRTTPSGRPVSAGTVVTEVNGEPVFLFAGPFDFYRDLGPGLTGPDVRQLQVGLRAAGLPVTANGTFGSQTGAAVASLYQRAGYPPTDHLPLADLTVTPTLPAALVSAPAVGTHPDGQRPLVTLGRGTVVARIELDSAAVVRVTAGMSAQLSIDGKAIGSAAVSAVAENSTGSGTGLSEVMLTPATALPAADIGLTVVGIVTIHAMARDALLVPNRALATAADGQTRVLAERSTGQPAPVPVLVLGDLGGVAAIRPVSAGSLVVGDRVEVG